MTDLSTLGPYFREYFDETKRTVDAPYLLEAIQRIVPILLKARDDDRTIFFCGNGGSSSTASHFVVDIAKVTASRPAPGGGPRRFKCLALNDNTPSVTAWANDADYSKVFAEPLKNLASRGDVLVAISGSGNSPNVLEAVHAAKEIGVTVIGLTGIGGGKLKGLADVALVVPSQSMQHTEDVHLLVLHFLTAYLRDRQA